MALHGRISPAHPAARRIAGEGGRAAPYPDDCPPSKWLGYKARGYARDVREFRSGVAGLLIHGAAGMPVRAARPTRPEGED